MIYLKRLLFILFKVVSLAIMTSLMCLSFPPLIVILSIWFYVKEGSCEKADGAFSTLWDVLFGLIDKIEPKK
jgi:hypothetical protein